MDDLSRLRIPVATFMRVFDTEPAREVVTLPELITTLTRFELKPEVQRRVDRELERARAAYEAMSDGEHASGPFAKRLAAKRDAHIEDGEEPEAALDAALAELEKDVRKKVKTDLRLWSPALYVEGGRREKEDVSHVSCLVIDHDDGTDLDVVREVWAPWFHIVHTTWSHTPEHPRFRVILPLSAAIEAHRWAKVYDWAIARSEGEVDPTGRGVATTFALPVIPNLDHPRVAYSHAGALLDPVAEGVISENTPPDADTLAGISPPTPSFTGDPERSYTSTLLEAPPQSPRGTAEDPFDDQALWDAVAGGEIDDQPASSPASPVAKPAARPALDRLAEWVEQVAPAALAVDALERLEGLRDRGALTDEEFEDAKAAVLADLRVHTPPWAG